MRQFVPTLTLTIGTEDGVIVGVCETVGDAGLVDVIVGVEVGVGVISGVASSKASRVGAMEVAVVSLASRVDATEVATKLSFATKVAAAEVATESTLEPSIGGGRFPIALQAGPMSIIVQSRKNILFFFI